MIQHPITVLYLDQFEKVHAKLKETEHLQADAEQYTGAVKLFRDFRPLVLEFCALVRGDNQTQAIGLKQTNRLLNIIRQSSKVILTSELQKVQPIPQDVRILLIMLSCAPDFTEEQYVNFVYAISHQCGSLFDTVEECVVGLESRVETES